MPSSVTKRYMAQLKPVAEAISVPNQMIEDGLRTAERLIAKKPCCDLTMPLSSDRECSGL